MSWTGKSMRRQAVIALCIWAMAVLPVLAQGAKKPRPKLDVPYVPTHQVAVEEMLKLAKVTSADFVIDLGCGDGRIVITAAKKYKAHGLGVDLDPQRVRESKANAKKAGVTELVKFMEADVMKTDVRKASVVTLFLLERINVRLRPKLFVELKPGTRVVSNSFTMRDWKPDKQIRHAKAYNTAIYYWVIPAPAGGTWTWKTKLGKNETTSSLKLEQEFQVVQGTISRPGGTDVPIAKALLTGKDLSFTASLGTGKKEVVVTYRGVVEGDVIRGTQKWASGPQTGTYPWVAKRKAADLTGRWQIRAPSHSDWNGTLHIRRKAGKLEASYVRDAKPKKELPLPGFYVWGTSIRFEVPASRTPLAFRGSLQSDAGGGSVSRTESTTKTKWTAKRLADK